MAEASPESVNVPNPLTLGGKTTHAPLVLAMSDKDTDVFHIGLSGKLYQSCRTGGYNAGFKGWYNLSSTLISSMAGVSSGPNRMDIFAIASETNYLLHMPFDPRSHDFEVVKVNNQTITVLGEITAATFQNDAKTNLFVFYRDGNNWPNVVYWTKARGWTALTLEKNPEFRISGAPRAVTYTNGRDYFIEVFVRDLKNNVHTKCLKFPDLDNIEAGIFSHWSQFPGDPVIDDPTVVHVVSRVSGKDRTHVISRNQNNAVLTRWYRLDDNTWTPQTGWNTWWAVAGSPVQAVAGAEKITLAAMGDENVMNTAEIGFDCNIIADWLRTRAPEWDGVKMIPYPVLHPRSDPGYDDHHNAVPLEVFFRAADNSIQRLLVDPSLILPRAGPK